ncbi:hypothetical protein ACE1ET_07720 [Saccharicrinis sp. FJH62]|uniref:hypothetical protein n=1 Tax=Saccharicrinis sp. FJH62 TaxID=3344657 RepID=UPI0035D40235
MKKVTIILVALVFIVAAKAQSSNNKIAAKTGSQYVGMNLLQYTSLTINGNYSKEYKPWITGMADIGYTLNYSKTNPYDVVGYILTPHKKGVNEGFDLSKQNGGYLKIGAFYNFRKTYEKTNYVHLGLFLNNSFVYEKALFTDPKLDFHPYPVPYSHGVLMSGLSVSAGYEFKFLKFLVSSVDFQVSLPTGNYKDLYGYSNFIPGMGHKDVNSYWFPMLIWNVKYKL